MIIFILFVEYNLPVSDFERNKIRRESATQKVANKSKDYLLSDYDSEDCK